MADDDLKTWFAVFNEIAIVAQLSRALFEARLPDGVVVPQFAVLNHLVRVGEGPTPLDLARAFQVPKTTMTHTLAGLERRGLVEMRPNPADGRSKTVWLTDAGRAFREEAIARLGPDVAALARALPTERYAALLPELETLRRTLDAMRP
ncbi:MarR family transcriptional regulator [Rhodobacteraceae bacterium CCMM004]|nr:MarR family transcriptional regulator [Rhodobacteraceae bacterium CCMM004]